MLYRGRLTPPQCDGKVPSCTRCVDASVPCVGFDSSTQREAPRSIAAFLEAHIANLENPSSPAFRQPPRPPLVSPSPVASPASDPHHQFGPERCTHADRLVNEVMEDITPSFLGVSKLKPILNCVVRGTQIPSGGRGPVIANDLDQNHPRSIINPQPSWAGLDAIDQKTADGLYRNFIDRVLILYPIYHRDDISKAFNFVYQPTPNQDGDSSRMKYITSMVIAISIPTAAKANHVQANAHAYSIVQHAMQYIPEVATNDLAGLQALLLLTHYVFLNPAMADVWLLTGLISQAVIDFGLHQELPYDTRITSYDRDMRRRLFWVAWEMEVAVCSIFLRPISLPSRHYHVTFPLDMDDAAITQEGIDYTRRGGSKLTSRKIWLFRQIEAEVISVIHQNEPMPSECTTLQQWMQKIETSMHEWHRRIDEDAAANRDPEFDLRWNEMKLYSDIAQPYILVTMYRPSRRIPVPDTENLIIAFENAVRVADNYCKQFNIEAGNIKYVFHSCHHSFNSAQVFLNVLKRCPSEISERYSLEQIEDSIRIFARCFSIIAERWPAATGCLEEFERLLTPIKKDYENFLREKATQARTNVTLGNSAREYYNFSGVTDAGGAYNLVGALNPLATMESADPPEVPAHDVPLDWKKYNFGFGGQ